MKNKKINLVNRFNNEKGSGLILTAFLVIVLGLSCASLYGMSIWQSKYMGIEISREKAFYYAEAGIDSQLQRLRSGNTNSMGTVTIDDGSYTATYNSSVSPKTITATGTYGGVTRTIVAKILRQTNFAIRGAITGNGNMITAGNVTIDGRDHDLDGNVVGPGTYGISVSGELSQTGSSDVGGNGAAPADPAPAGSIEQNGPGISLTPEDILGVPVGSLDAYKRTTPPTLPMSGIVYMTANEDGKVWQPTFGDCDSGPSTGILIFHNATNDAEIKNMHGCFKGIIISDKFTHINANAMLRGALAVLASGGNVGNGNADVQYSTEALNSTNLASYTIISWEDSLN